MHSSLFLAPFFVLLSCWQTAFLPVKNFNKNSPSSLIDKSIDLPVIRGTYRGNFDQSPIEIVLESVTDAGMISGYSLHKGLKRSLKGTWQIMQESNKVKLILTEPGDHKYDGYFVLVLNTKTLEANGSWFPKPDSGLGEVLVTLKKVV